MRPKRAVLVVSGTVFVILITWYLLPGEDGHSGSTTIQDSRNQADRHSVTVSPRESKPDAIRQAADQAGLIIAVSDLAGNALADASALKLDKVTGKLTALDARDFVGNAVRKSSDAGLIHLSEHLLKDPSLALESMRIYIQSQGYMIGRVQLAPSKRRYSVRLLRGGTLRVRAQLEDGTALAGIRFRILSEDMGLAFEESAQTQGAYLDPNDQAREQFLGETGKDGWLSVSNLEMHAYLVSPIFSADPYIPAANQSVILAHPPFQDAIFHFTVPLALIESVKDDNVRGGMTADESRWWTTDGAAHSWCLAKMRTLQKRHPGTYVSIRLRKKGVESPRHVDLSLRTDHHGWVDAKVQYLPLTEFSKPRQHVVHKRQAPGSFLLRLETANGQEIKNAYGFRLTLQSAASSAGDIRLTTSVPVDLPAGQYLLRAPLLWPGRKKSLDLVTVRAGRQLRHVVRLTETLMPNEIRILRPDGTLPVVASFTYDIEGASSGGQNYRPALSPTKSMWFWLAEKAKFEYRVRCFGFPMLEGSFLSNSVGTPANERLILIKLHR